MPAGVHLGLSKIGCLLGACRSSSRIKGGNSAGQVPAARCLLKHKDPFFGLPARNSEGPFQIFSVVGVVPTREL